MTMGGGDYLPSPVDTGVRHMDSLFRNQSVTHFIGIELEDSSVVKVYVTLTGASIRKLCRDHTLDLLWRVVLVDHFLQSLL